MMARLAFPVFRNSKGHDSRCKCFEIKYLFWLSLQLSFEPSLLSRRIWRGIILNALTSSCKVFFCPILTENKFSRPMLIKVGNIKFHSNLSGGRRDFPCGTDGRKKRRTDMMNIIVAFRNFANAPTCTERKSNIVSCFDLPRQTQQTRAHVSSIRDLLAEQRDMVRKCCLLHAVCLCLLRGRTLWYNNGNTVTFLYSCSWN